MMQSIFVCFYICLDSNNYKYKNHISKRERVNDDNDAYTIFVINIYRHCFFFIEYKYLFVYIETL